ncbi:hypothetical protein MBAV_004143 [Candidatus Magnetobacterium bavaricum]|uniref:Uncharacterized protein n=1 Tax=Candidatus Magnetobacterium bavaricum TaxID=29290 RepID=A0A0F3GSJ5_9BACT|nr:hypothetical protein MBAV_004143 [Candidatus Magnetobacterium bavaricum]
MISLSFRWPCHCLSVTLYFCCVCVITPSSYNHVYIFRVYLHAVADTACFFTSD